MPPPVGPRESGLQDVAARAIGVVLAAIVIVVGWNILSLLTPEQGDGRRFPTFAASVSGLDEMSDAVLQGDSLLGRVGATLGQVITVFLVAMFLGSLLGGLAGVNRWTKGLSDPLFSALRLLSPVLVVWASVFAQGLDGHRLTWVSLPVAFVVADGMSRAVFRRSQSDVDGVVDSVVAAARYGLLLSWIVVGFDGVIGLRDGIFAGAARAANLFRTQFIGTILILALLLALLMDVAIRLIGLLVKLAAKNRTGARPTSGFAPVPQHLAGPVGHQGTGPAPPRPSGYS